MLRRPRLPVIAAVHEAEINKYVSVTATSGLRHCDLNDLLQAIERPSNRSRIVVVTIA